jgi:hypothetical protein
LGLLKWLWGTNAACDQYAEMLIAIDMRSETHPSSVECGDESNKEMLHMIAFTIIKKQCLAAYMQPLHHYWFEMTATFSLST